MFDLNRTHEFRPELLSRRAEITAWALSAVLLVTWWILQANQAVFAGTALVLFIFMLFAAIGTSLGNWIDRKSILRLDPAGVYFENGLRHVRLEWPQVERVQVLPAQAGAQRVQVLGSRTHFEFRTLAELTLNGEVKGRSGFADGSQILQTILSAAKLSRKSGDAPYMVYARE